jgi:hypothetical protein
MGCLPWWSRDWLARSCGSLLSPSSTVGYTILQLTSLVKDKNPKFKVGFLLNVYRFHTIAKLRNCKWSHRRWGTICNTFCSPIYHLSVAFGFSPLLGYCEYCCNEHGYTKYLFESLISVLLGHVTRGRISGSYGDYIYIYIYIYIYTHT